MMFYDHKYRTTLFLNILEAKSTFSFAFQPKFSVIIILKNYEH